MFPIPSRRLFTARARMVKGFGFKSCFANLSRNAEKPALISAHFVGTSLPLLQVKIGHEVQHAAVSWQ